jgi:hypothetical protein
VGKDDQLDHSAGRRFHGGKQFSGQDIVFNLGDMLITFFEAMKHKDEWICFETTEASFAGWQRP